MGEWKRRRSDSERIFYRFPHNCRQWKRKTAGSGITAARSSATCHANEHWQRGAGILFKSSFEHRVVFLNLIFMTFSAWIFLFATLSTQDSFELHWACAVLDGLTDTVSTSLTDALSYTLGWCDSQQVILVLPKHPAASKIFEKVPKNTCTSKLRLQMGVDIVWAADQLQATIITFSNLIKMNINISINRRYNLNSWGVGGSFRWRILISYCHNHAGAK